MVMSGNQSVSSILPPVYSSSGVERFDLINIPEGIVTNYHNFIDGAAGNSKSIVSSPHGSDVALTRADLGAKFLLPGNNETCFVFNSSTPSPSAVMPSLSSLIYVGNSLLDGTQPAWNFRVTFPETSFKVGAHVDQADGQLRLLTNAGNEGQVMVYSEFLNGTVPDASVFDVPSSCTAASAVTVPEDLWLPSLPSRRLTLMAENAAFVAKHNTDSSSSSFSLKLHPRFAGMPLEEAVAAPLVPPPPKSPKATTRSVYYRRRTEEAPASVDRRDDGAVAPIRDQGTCGSCWAFATAAAVETNVALASKTSADSLSPQNLLDCVTVGDGIIRPKGCFGGWPETALGFLVDNNYSLSRDAIYPYEAVTGAVCGIAGGGDDGGARIANYTAIEPGESSEADMAHAVAENGAVIAIVEVLQDFVFYDSGVYDQPLCTGALLSHAIAIVGYGTDSATGLDYWLIKNSFGMAWGESGYMKMRRGVNMCGIGNWALVPLA